MDQGFLSYLDGLLASLKDVEGSLKGTVVLNSQQVAGSLAQRQEQPLADRVSKDRHGAEVQKNLEASKGGKITVEEKSKVSEMDTEVVNKYVDELMNKFLGKSLNG